MLFDLQGKRRRVVQATYLGLAVLMGGGLVLFGIGGDVSGGLFDAFKDDGGGGNGNSVIEKRIETAEKQLQQNPRNKAALIALTRGHYQLATASSDPSTAGFDEEGKKELAEATQAWERYLALEPKKVEPSLARLVVQAYDVTALNKPAKAARAANLAAEAKPTSNAYILVVQYADLAGNKRLADLAGNRAIDLASKGKKETVRQQVEQAKQAKEQTEAAKKAQEGAQQGGAPQGGAPAPAPGAPPGSP
ncbi:MAG: hypothetical protein WD649_03915 [Thermoleophilaceae bacterium]